MEQSQLTDRQILEAILDAAQEKNDLLHNVADNQHKIMDQLKVIIESMNESKTAFDEKTFADIQSQLKNMFPGNH